MTWSRWPGWASNAWPARELNRAQPRTAHRRMRSRSTTLAGSWAATPWLWRTAPRSSTTTGAGGSWSGSSRRASFRVITCRSCVPPERRTHRSSRRLPRRPVLSLRRVALAPRPRTRCTPPTPVNCRRSSACNSISCGVPWGSSRPRYLAYTSGRPTLRAALRRWNRHRQQPRQPATGVRSCSRRMLWVQDWRPPKPWSPRPSGRQSMLPQRLPAGSTWRGWRGCRRSSLPANSILGPWGGQGTGSKSSKRGVVVNAIAGRGVASLEGPWRRCAWPLGPSLKNFCRELSLGHGRSL
mmetsp:Transcript_91417/g.258870  ORF Transcript_91417/g.258870 Transcript_91417/m.258870 type:complete len:296 (-) Transcript_91417:317-1204(-)